MPANKRNAKKNGLKVYLQKAKIGNFQISHIKLNTDVKELKNNLTILPLLDNTDISNDEGLEVDNNQIHSYTFQPNEMSKVRRFSDETFTRSFLSSSNSMIGNYFHCKDDKM